MAVTLVPASVTGTWLAIIAVVSMVGGYILLAALWFFVFREKPAERAERLRQEAAAMQAAAQGPAHADSWDEPGLRAGHERLEIERREIERRAGSRFRRR